MEDWATERLKDQQTAHIDFVELTKAIKTNTETEKTKQTEKNVHESFKQQNAEWDHHGGMSEHTFFQKLLDSFEK